MKIASAVLSFVVSLILFAGVLGAAPRGIQSIGGFEKQAMDATFALYVAPLNRFICSATAVRVQQDRHSKRYGYLLLSAGHCVYGEPSDFTFAVAEEIGGRLVPVAPVKARLGNAEDVSLFYMETAKKYPVIELGDESSETIGDAEINPNFTAGLTKQLAYARIASGVIGENEHCPICMGTFLIHETAGPGASGSAVISEKTHKVIGIAIIAGVAGIGVEPISTVRKALSEPDEYEQLHQLPSDDDDN